MQSWEEFIGQVDLFSVVPLRERESLLAAVQEREMRRKKILPRPGGETAPLLVVARGALKAVREDQPGRRLIVDFVGPTEVLGEEAVLTGGGWDYELVAVENSTVLAFSQEAVGRLLENYPRFGRAMAALAATRARAYRERLYFFNVAPVQVRLAGLLLQLARRFGKRDRKGTVIDLHVTHQDFAEYIGASRETVTLALAKLKEEGSIQTNVRRIIIPDLKNLKKLAQLK